MFVCACVCLRDKHRLSACNRSFKLPYPWPWADDAKDDGDDERNRQHMLERKRPDQGLLHTCARVRARARTHQTNHSTEHVLNTNTCVSPVLVMSHFEERHGVFYMCHSQKMLPLRTHRTPCYCEVPAIQCRMMLKLGWQEDVMRHLWPLCC